MVLLYRALLTTGVIGGLVYFIGLGGYLLAFGQGC
jgi:hypothetical protein